MLGQCVQKEERRLSRYEVVCEGRGGGRSAGTGGSRWAGVWGSSFCARLLEESVRCSWRRASASCARTRGMSHGWNEGGSSEGVCLQELRRKYTPQSLLLFWSGFGEGLRVMVQERGSPKREERSG